MFSPVEIASGESDVPAVKPLHIGVSLVKSIGGQGESVRHFCQALGGTVVSFTHENLIREEASYIPGTIHVPVPHRGISGLAMKPAARALIEAENAVSECNLLIVNLLYRYHVHWVFKMASRYRLPVWIVLHGALDPYVFSYNKLQKVFWLKLWGERFLRMADRVIFSTQRERNKAAPIYDGSNSRVISWPVGMADMGRLSEARKWIRDRFRIPSGQRVLLFLGRYEKSKRPLETIEAYANAACSNTVLLVVGIEEQYGAGQLREHARKLGLRDQVKVSGPIYGDDKELLLLGVDGFISLSWKENFGYTTAEAMAAGLPVILSPGNDLRSLMGTMDCGWMLPDFDVSSAARAIHDFDLEGIDRLRDKGAAARCWAERNLKFEVFRQALLNEWHMCWAERLRFAS
jgi:glycosyltransferase involved in cell wall biosynthesis